MLTMSLWWPKITYNFRLNIVYTLLMPSVSLLVRKLTLFEPVIIVFRRSRAKLKF